MLRPIACFMILCPFAALAADEKPQQMADEAVAILKKLNSAFAGVKDAVTARKQLPSINKLYARLNAVQDRLMKLPQADRNTVLEIFDTKGRKFSTGLANHIKRVQRDPMLYAVLKETDPLKLRSQADRKLTLLRLRIITQALDLYRFTNGKYPAALSDLGGKATGSNKPYINKQELLDPWGRSFHYDIKGPKNKKRKPDVWSLGPTGTKESIIGNWEKKTK